MSGAILPAFGLGLGLGVAVAAQVGPISLLCVRSVLRGRWSAGVAIGLGAAVIDIVYAALGVAGAAPVLRIAQLRVALGLGGAAVLLWIGFRTFWSALRVRGGLETAAEVGSAGRALLTSLVATASNPLTILYWAGVFAAASVASVARGPAGAAALLAGIGCGSLGWFVVLSSGVALARRRVGERGLRIADAGSGMAIMGFAGLLGWRVARSG